MGENEAILPNGLLGNNNEINCVTRVLDFERWRIAEERTAELIACIQPNQPSEEKRNAVASFVQELIKKCISCQVFTFGSVPLKTYLPDGDIDLTAFSQDENLKDTWANEVRDALQNEEKNEKAEFRVKEVQYIQAEVKLIKCLVENIVVDISFNQVGGLCTLCFLEEVDHLIDHNHLFKRSIILIKAWCYYESRILGAHHGLISTYALETLVLYIFNVFNNSFAGPLEVLYRFLEFFSNFDWDNFCVSLWGPVPISSLPDITAEPPRRDRSDLLLNKSFLDSCNSVYAVSQGRIENQSQPFISKHFNVIDPLRTNNNLGRSVSKGNFFRIRSAFAFGAKKLAKLLECPKENLIAEVNQFFTNTWERHGNGLRPDAPILKLQRSQKSESIPVNESKSNTSRGASSITKKIEKIGISQQLNNVDMTSNPSVSRSQIQNNFGNHIDLSESEQIERSITSSDSVQHGASQKNLEPGPKKIHFARTRSSPELTERQGRVLGTGKPQNSNARFDNNNKKLIMVAQDNPSTLSHSSSHHSLEAHTSTSSVSNSYHDELPSVSKALEIQDMQQEQQDLVNMMASRPHGINGQAHLPMHLTSPHLPFHGQRNFSGYFPNNITFINPSWGSNMQFPQSYVTSPVPPYLPNTSNPGSNLEENVGTDLNPEDSDHGVEVNSINNFVPLSLGNSLSSSFMPGQQKVHDDPSSSVRNPNMRILPTPQTSTPRTTSGESSREGLSTNVKSVKDKWGRKSVHGDEDIKNMPDAHAEYEPAQNINGPDSMIPIAPMIINNYRQRVENNSGVVFYPTGPPVPFLTMLPFPMYNYQSGSSNPDNSVDDSRIEDHDSADNPKITGSEASEPDILNSDFQSHFKNLQFGRHCQTSNTPLNYGQFSYSSQIIVPPGYLQGHVAWEGPGRPVSNNHNFFTPVMSYGSRLVQNRNSGVFQRYGDVAPRFRGGTGTYLPNPKVPYRDRQFPVTRNHRGNNYNNDRSDHTDREGSWINTKSRATNRNHGRNQADRSITRPDNRTGPADRRSDRSWNSYRHEGQNSYFGASNSSHSSGNMPHGVYSLSNVNPNVMMMYPYDQGVGYGSSSSESVELGSHVPVQISDVNEIPQPNEGRVHDQRLGSRASPDQPSSPHVQRSTIQSNYQAQEDDFPPLSITEDRNNIPHH